MKRTCATCGQEFKSNHNDPRRRNCSLECRKAAGYHTQRDTGWQLRKFYARITPDPISGCWMWRQPDTNGYGRFLFEGKDWWAHRLAYHLHVDDIPDGFQIDHLCRRTACVNPDHLEAVTPRENNIRSNSLSARRYRVARGLPALVPAVIDEQLIAASAHHRREVMR